MGQLERIATVAPDVAATIRAQTDLGWIRTNTNTFSSARLVALRSLEREDQNGALVLTDGAGPSSGAGRRIRVDWLIGLQEMTEADLAAALVEYARKHQVAITSACELGDRIVTRHLDALVTFGPVASAWPRRAEE